MYVTGTLVVRILETCMYNIMFTFLYLQMIHVILVSDIYGQRVRVYSTRPPAKK